MSEGSRTDNAGRALTLLNKMPNIKDWWTGYADDYYGSGCRITIKLTGGFTYMFYGYEGNGVVYVNEAIRFAYLNYLRSL